MRSLSGLPSHNSLRRWLSVGIGCLCVLTVSCLNLFSAPLTADSHTSSGVIKKSDDVFQTHIVIRGISCEGCMRRIERTLREKPGVVTVALNRIPYSEKIGYGGVSASVSYHAGDIKLSDILEVIKPDSSDYEITKNEHVSATKPVRKGGQRRPAGAKTK